MWKLFFAFSLYLVMSGCSKDGEQKAGSDGDVSSRIIRVVTTTGMIADAVKNVGGERVDVTALMGPGVDPHLYKASAGDVSKMSKADVIFYNGLHLEGKMTEIFKEMRRFTRTSAVAEGIETSRLLSPPEFNGNYDPHVWFDVTMWIEVVESIENTLVQIDSAHSEYYSNRTADYIRKLEELHEYALSRAVTVPEGKRYLVTAHDAFNYFGRAYGFQVLGLQGISTASEAGAADVQNLAHVIFEKKIPAIFVETSVPSRSIKALQAAVRARGFDVKVGGNLFSDAMGSEETPEGNYIGMVRHNIETIVTALTN
ncbi:MAG: manganese transporter [Calditrichaeota bacterium]|nr:zinc ABC transporter substrate-binding protein [Calditrichota bacterium]RQW04236.1 MAG: manganese transporter [Calditrichota bacterium]